MSFERFRTQLECEKIVGCTSLDKWNSYKASFERVSLHSDKVTILISALLEDANTLYFKGILSLCESISSINRHLYSWATVKAYYSIFYLLRCSLALNGYAIVRNKSLYLLKLKEGEQPLKISKCRNDHECVIKVYSDLYGGSDKLQSNTIDQLSPYYWLMQCRNQVNYRQREFNDPDPPNFLRFIASAVDSKKLDQLITFYVDDQEFLYCFQADHAVLALPIKRLLLTQQDLSNTIGALLLSNTKYKLLSNLLKIDSKPLSIIKSILHNIKI